MIYLDELLQNNCLPFHFDGRSVLDILPAFLSRSVNRLQNSRRSSQLTIVAGRSDPFLWPEPLPVAERAIVKGAGT